MKRRYLPALLAITATTIAACGHNVLTPASAPPATETTTTTDEWEYSKAPPVAEPLDVTTYMQDPCASLSPAKQQEFNITSSRSSEDELGVGCIWDVGTGFTSIMLSYPTKNRNGLSNLYALNDTVGWAYWEPTEIDGYPAVFHSIVDHRERGDCGLGVGTSDDIFMSIGTRSRTGNGICKAARNVASAALATIKAGQ